MLTIICTIKFEDGEELTGTITANSPQGAYPVNYEGALERWPTRVDKTRPATLKVHFQNFANLTKSQFNFATEGEYDIWAE